MATVREEGGRGFESDSGAWEETPQFCVVPDPSLEPGRAHVLPTHPTPPEPPGAARPTRPSALSAGQ